jgi:hypothetical protein
VTLLFGLPCTGRAIGARDIPESWREDLLAWFALIVHNTAEPVLALLPPSGSRTYHDLVAAVHSTYLNIFI